MVLRTWHIGAVIALLAGLGVSLAFNLYPLVRTPSIIGIADSKSIGQGTDQRGDMVTWYTVSLALVTEDKKNHMPVGGTLAYIIDKEDFDRIQEGAVVEGRPGDGLRLQVLELVHSERFASDHLFFRQRTSD